MARFSQRSKDALKGVHPDLVRLMGAAIMDTPVDFTITEGLRTTARQKELYAQGRSAPGPRVTKADGVNNKSDHQAKADGYGHAVDLYPFIGGRLLVQGPEAIAGLKAIAKHIKANARDMGIAITWGGDWKDPYDPPHFELRQ